MKGTATMTANRYKVYLPQKPQHAVILVAANGFEARKIASAVTPGTSPSDFVSVRELEAPVSA